MRRWEFGDWFAFVWLIGALAFAGFCLAMAAVGS